MTFSQIIILTIIGYIIVYSIVDRICKCVEHYMTFIESCKNIVDDEKKIEGFKK